MTRAQLVGPVLVGVTMNRCRVGSGCRVLVIVCLVAVLGVVGAALAGGGKPVTGTDHEKRVEKIVAALVDGSYSNWGNQAMVSLGPGLVHVLPGGQKKFAFGGPVHVGRKVAGKKKYFLGRILGRELPTVIRSDAFRKALGDFAGQPARPATEAERALYYELGITEIEGRAVSVVEVGGRRLLIEDAADIRQLWVDLIDEYPIPSVADTWEEAIRIGEKLKR